MSDTTQTFSAQGLQDAYAALFAASLQAQLQAQTLMQQPPATLQSVPSLPADLLAAQAAARAEVRAAEPALLRAVAEGISYGNLQASMYETLFGLATAIDQGGSARSAAQAQFTSGLQLLTQQIHLLEPVLEHLVCTASDVQTTAQASATALATDAISASTDPQVKALQADISATQDALTADCATIANSMKGTVVGEVKLGIAMYNLEDDAMGAVKAFVGFILDSSNKEAAVQTALHDEQVQLKKLAGLYDQLGMLASSVAVVQTLAGSASQLAAAAASQASASEQLSSGWHAYRASLTELEDQVSSGAALPLPLAPAMATQRDAWNLLAQGLSAWQLKGTANATVILAPN
jgi:hypothetical protein